MNNSYSIVDPALFLKEKEYEEKVKLLQKNENEFPNIYFKINEGNFKNWFIQITDVDIIKKKKKDAVSMRCKYSVVKVPKSISDKDIKDTKPELDLVVGQVFEEIIQETNSLLES
jgi:hypothetical protein